MAKKSKFYVVFVGRKPGVYDSWEEAEAQVKNFPLCKHSAYATRLEAESAYASFDKLEQAELMKKSLQKSRCIEDHARWRAMHDDITGL